MLNHEVQEKIKLYAELPNPLLAIPSEILPKKTLYLWALFVGSCYQGIPLKHLYSFLQKFWQAFGESAFKTPLIHREKILNVLVNSQLKNWDLAPYVPGILWRIVELDQGERLQDWSEMRTMQEMDAWLRRNLFFIGKENEWSSKVRLIIFLLSAPRPAGLGIQLTGEVHPPFFEWNDPKGLASLPELQIPKRLSTKDPLSRIHSLREIARLFDPNRPWVLEHWHLHSLLL